jgi:hypothetical protein
MPLGHFGGHVEHLQPHYTQAFVLKSAEDSSDEAARHSVGLK